VPVLVPVFVLVPELLVPELPLPELLFAGSVGLVLLPDPVPVLLDPFPDPLPLPEPLPDPLLPEPLPLDCATSTGLLPLSDDWSLCANAGAASDTVTANAEDTAKSESACLLCCI